jgi:hypothetical protein
MPARFLAALLLPGFLLSAANKKVVGTGRGENEDLILTVTLYADPMSVKDAIGSDLDGHYIVANVKVAPKYGKEVSVYRDDFLLRTDKDGDKSKPFAPSQIAGKGAIVLSPGKGQGGGGGGMETGPVGYPGGYPPGYPGGYPPGGYPPMGMPGGGIGVGGGGGDSGDVKATVTNGAGEKENPIKKVLADKILPEKKTDQPFAGMLYFPMEKQKLKDLQLDYGGRENRIRIRFKEEK